MSFPLIRPEYYLSLFKDIVRFIQSPHNQPDLEKSATLKVYDTIGLFILKMIFLIPVLLFFGLIYDPPNVQSSDMAERFSPLALLLVGGIVLPLVEEIAFRLSLLFKPLYLALSSSALLYYLLTKVVFHTKISAVDDSFVHRLVLALSFGVLLFFILHIKAINERVAHFWDAHFPGIFYTLCLIFAWMHISKYEISWLNILLLPILTLPQLFSAFIYSYTRVLFGFKYPLILHVTMNSIAIGLTLLPFAD